MTLLWLSMPIDIFIFPEVLYRAGYLLGDIGNGTDVFYTSQEVK